MLGLYLNVKLKRSLGGGNFYCVCESFNRFVQTRMDTPTSSGFGTSKAAFDASSISKNWNQTLTVDDDVDREHKDARLLKNALLRNSQVS